jgi:hydroxyacylglutathione hydrolase
MLLRRFYEHKLAQASYMVGCQATGEALVVDPHRDTNVYVRAAEEEGVRVRWVTETHIHADYLSGSRQLAKRTGAQLVLSGEGGEDWRYAFAAVDGARTVHEGDELRVGNIGVRVLHTPGHTPEHICFMLTDGAATSEPMGVLTGDFIFVGDVGRPDLLEKAAGMSDTMETAARLLYRSLERFRELPGYLQILPGHGAGSACGKALGAVPTSTLGYERLVSWAFQCDTEDGFVAAVLRDQPEPPTYFARMKRLNRDGPPLLDALPAPPRLPPSGLGPLLEKGAVVVDTRAHEEFAAGHVPGTLNIPLGKEFPTWCGWLIPYDRPVYLIVGGEAGAREAARDLALIGMDDSAGYFDPAALEAWRAGRGALEQTPGVDWGQAERAVSEQGAYLLDVRRRTEWDEGHVSGAEHVHLGHLGGRVAELPRDRPIVLYCRTGNRSGIGASLLQAHGFEDVRNVEGGIVERADRGLALVSG